MGVFEYITFLSPHTAYSYYINKASQKHGDFLTVDEDNRNFAHFRLGPENKNHTILTYISRIDN